MNDRLPGSSWSNPIWYKEKWRIAVCDEDARAFGGYSYSFVHDDYDGAEDANDNRHGHGKSIEDCQREIDEIESDE